MSNGSDFTDLRKAWLGSWFDLRQLWADRRAILFDPASALSGEIPLGNRPWPFAVQAALLPGTIVAAVIAIAFAFVDLPPLPAERLIALMIPRIEKAQARLELYDRLSNGVRRRRLVRLSLAELLTREETLAASLSVLRPALSDAASQSNFLEKTYEHRAVVNELNVRYYESLAPRLANARGDLAVWQLIRSLQLLVKNALFVLTGMTLFVNATLFRWLMSKGGAPFDFNFMADSVYLYLVGATLCLPNFLVYVIYVAFDLASRYFVDEPIMPVMVVGMIVAVVAISIYSLVRQILTIRPIAFALGPQIGTTPRSAFWHVAFRFFGATLITAMVNEILIIVVLTVLIVGMNIVESMSHRFGM